MMKRFIFVAIITTSLLNSCKKEKIVEKDFSVNEFYKSAGLEYMTTLGNDSNEVLPQFAGVMPDRKAIKMVYSEKENGLLKYKSFIWENGLKRQWVVPAEGKYYSWWNPYLSIDGSLVGNGENYTVIENNENNFSILDKTVQYGMNHALLKLDTRVMGRDYTGDESEYHSYTGGNYYYILNLHSDYTKDMVYNKTQLFSDKMWRYDLQEYDKEHFVLSYTKGDRLYVSLLNTNFEKTIIDSRQLTRDYIGYAPNCQISVMTGSEICTVRNGNNPFFYFLWMRRFHSRDLYQLKDNKIICVDSSLSRTDLFGCNGLLYAKDNKQLERFENGKFTKVNFGEGITIIAIYGNENGILLAVKRKDDTSTHFDLVRYNS